VVEGSEGIELAVHLFLERFQPAQLFAGLSINVKFGFKLDNNDKEQPHGIFAEHFCFELCVLIWDRLATGRPLVPRPRGHELRLADS